MRSQDEKQPESRQDETAEALQALHSDWGREWAIGCGGDHWQAARRDRAGHVLTRASAAGLELALRAGYGRGGW